MKVGFLWQTGIVQSLPSIERGGGGRELRRAAGRCWLLREASRVLAPDGSRFESWQWCDLLVHELTSSLPRPNPSALWDSARTDCWNVFFQRRGIWPSSSPTKWTCSQERPRCWCPGNAPRPPCSPGELSSASLPFRSAVADRGEDVVPFPHPASPTRPHHARSCLRGAGGSF